MDFLPRLCMSPAVTEANSKVVLNDSDVIRIFHQHTRDGLQGLANKWLDKYPATELDSAILLPLFLKEDVEEGTGIKTRRMQMPTTTEVMKKSAIFSAIGQVLIELKGKDVSVLSDKMVLDRVFSVIESINGNKLTESSNFSYTRVVTEALGTSDNPKSLRVNKDGTQTNVATYGMSLNTSNDITVWNKAEVLAVVGAGSLYEWTPSNRLIYVDREIYSPLGISYDDLMLMIKLMLAPGYVEPTDDSTIEASADYSLLLTPAKNKTDVANQAKIDKDRKERFDWISNSGLSLYTFLSIYDAAISETWSNLRKERSTSTVQSWGYRLIEFSYMLNLYVNTISRLEFLYGALRSMRLYDTHPMREAFTDIQLMPLKELQAIVPTILSHPLMLNLPQTISDTVDAIGPSGALIKSELPYLLLSDEKPSTLLPSDALDKYILDFQPGMDFEEQTDYVTSTINLPNLQLSTAKLSGQWERTLKFAKNVLLDLQLQEDFFKTKKAVASTFSFQYKLSQIVTMSKPKVYYNSIFDTNWYRTGIRRFDPKTGKHTYDKAKGQYLNHDKLLHDSVKSETYYPALLHFDPEDMPKAFLTTHIPAEYLTGEAYMPITSLGSHGEMAIFEKDAAQLHMQPSTIFDVTTQAMFGSKLSALFYSIMGNYMPIYTDLKKLAIIAKNLETSDEMIPAYAVSPTTPGLADIVKTKLSIHVFRTSLVNNKVKLTYQPVSTCAFTSDSIKALAQGGTTAIPNAPDATLNGIPVPEFLYYVSLDRTSMLPIWGLPSVAQTNLNIETLNQSSWRSILEQALYSHSNRSVMLLPIAYIPSRYGQSKILFDNSDPDKTLVQDVSYEKLNAVIYNVTRTRMFVFDVLHNPTMVKTAQTVYDLVSLKAESNSNLFVRATWTNLAANFGHMRLTFRPRSTFHQCHTFIGWSIGGYQAVFFKQSDMIMLNRDELLSAPDAHMTKATPMFSVGLKLAIDQAGSSVQAKVLESYAQVDQPLSDIKDPSSTPTLASGSHGSTRQIAAAVDKIDKADESNTIQIQETVEIKPPANYQAPAEVKPPAVADNTDEVENQIK